MYNIAVINQKGGVGKTTSVVHVGLALRDLGRRVLLVDLDPQAHLSISFNCPLDEGAADIGDVMLGLVDADSQLFPLAEHLTLLRSSWRVAGAEKKLVTLDKGRESRLKRALRPLRDRYDYALFDCPPHLGQLSMNALFAAQSALIPVSTDTLSADGLTNMVEVIAEMQDEEFNPYLEVLGVIPTRYRAQTRHAKRIYSHIAASMGDAVPVYSPIPEAIVFAEAVATHQSVFTYAPKSAGARAYRAVAQEVDSYVQHAIAVSRSELATHR